MNAYVDFLNYKKIYLLAVCFDVLNLMKKKVDKKNYTVEMSCLH